MPIPILGIIAALGAGAGAVKTIDALDDMSTAKRINREAQDLLDNTKNKIERTKESTNNALKELGKTKIGILSSNMKRFADSFSRLKNVDPYEFPGFEHLRNFTPSSSEFLNLKNASLKASELATGGLGSIAAGTLTAAGAYGAVGTFAAASTGTAISALSGAAAANATLAWLGGGALAAGGYGMAGGMYVLGGLVAAPALLVGGMFLGSKAEKALKDAESNKKQVENYASEGRTMCSTMDAIKNCSDQMRSVLNTLDDKFRPAVGEMISTMEWNGTDWRNYNRQSKEKVKRAVDIAQILYIIIDTRVLEQDGSLSAKCSRVIEQGRAKLSGI